MMCPQAGSARGVDRSEMKKQRQTDTDLVSCQLCEKSFRKRTKLQRHLLEDHPVDVTIVREKSPVGRILSDEQRKADEGVQEALAAANNAMTQNVDGRGVCCPQCMPEKKERLFTNAVDLATHMISKHNIFASECDSDDDDDDMCKSRNIAPLTFTNSDASLSEINGSSTEVSQRMLPKKRANASEKEVPAKRTKLLCVDVTNDGAVAPQPRNDPPRKMNPLKAEPIVFKQECNSSLPHNPAAKRTASMQRSGEASCKRARFAENNSDGKIMMSKAARSPSERQESVEAGNTLCTRTQGSEHGNVAGLRATPTRQGHVELTRTADGTCADAHYHEIVTTDEALRSRSGAAPPNSNVPRHSGTLECSAVLRTKSVSFSGSPAADGSEASIVHETASNLSKSSSFPEQPSHYLSGVLSLDFTDPFNP